MNNQEYLDQITIPVPCPQDWRQMLGNKRTRFCDLCGKKVHDLRAMTSEEVVALVTANDGELCGLMTQRADGTLVTASRRRSPSRRWTPFQFNISGLMSLIAWTAAACGLIRLMFSMPVVTAGGIRMRPTPSGIAAQCPEIDPADDVEPEECLDEIPIENPDAHPGGARK
jgi:hypothetical protein